MSQSLFSRIFLLFITIIALNSCGVADHPSHEGGTPLSPRMIKLASLGDGTISADVQVFDINGKLHEQRELTIDLVNGRAYTPEGQEIKTERGNTYSYFIRFFYETPAVSKLPIGFVLKSQKILEAYESIAWTAEEIILLPAQIAPDLAASFSLDSALIPNLDNDGDGFSNFAEFLDKSDPTDPNSVPQGPELVSSLDPQKIYQDEIAFSVSFKDNSGVANIKAVNPVCGYSAFEFHPVTEGDNGEVELKATFNLHATTVSDSINLTLKAIDVWGATREQTLTFKFTKNPNSPIHGPEIAILKPSEGESINGEAFAEAIACHEAEVISLAPTVGDVGDEDDAPESYQGKINTLALGDGPKTITFKAIAKNPQDPNQTYSQERGVNVQIDNNNPIRVDSPAPGATIQDVTAFIFSVDENKLPGVTELFVESVTANGEEDPVFASMKNGDDNSEASVYKKSVDTTSINDEREITINLKAISPTQTVTRKVAYRVQNTPKISLKLQNSDGSFNPCLVPGTATLVWEVTNRSNSDPIYLNDVEQKDGQGNWIAAGTKEIDCSETSYTLKAKRTGLDAQGNVKQFEGKATINLTQISLSGIKDGGNLPPTALQDVSFQLSGMPATAAWKVEWKKDGNNLPDIAGAGPTVNLGDLQLGAEYELTISLLNKNGKAISQHVMQVGAAAGLIGWWRFDDGNNLGKDSSPFLNSGLVNNVNVSMDNCILAACAVFNNSKIEIKDKVSLNPDDVTIETWVNWEAAQGWLVYKIFEYGFFTVGGTFIFEGTNQVQLSFDQLFSFNQWYHVSGVYNSQEGYMRVYVDGVMRGEKTVNVSLQKTANSLYLGDGIQGKLDEVRIYNRPLSQEDLKASCNQLKPGHCL